MKKLRSFFKWLGFGLLALMICLAVFLRLRYGGGKEYPDISGDPRYASADLELVFSYEEPIGNVAATTDTSGHTRVFFTIHPESRPSKYKLVEIVDGKAEPFPNEVAQKELFTTVLGVFCDGHNRLWTIDHGNHGFMPVKLLAFDLDSREIVHEYAFPSEVAEKLSFFNDLSVSPDGRYVFVADVSFFGKTPSLVLYDTEQGKSRSLLDGHESVAHQSYVPRPPAKKMRFFGGLVDLLTGIDGLDVSLDGRYVYYAAMGHSGLYRIPVSACTDFSLSAEEIAGQVEFVSEKPLSDGIRCDSLGRVYITDIEHQGIYVVDPENKKGFTLVKDERVRWADGMSGDGYFYLADGDGRIIFLPGKFGQRHSQPDASVKISHAKACAVSYTGFSFPNGEKCLRVGISCLFE